MMIQTEGKFKYIESGGGKSVLLLLHGLFGALSNFSGIIDKLGKDYNVVVPILPIYDLPLTKLSVNGLVNHVDEFVRFKGFEKINVLGNSLGGHVSLLYAMLRPGNVRTLTLTGSSGLYESAMGNTFPKRGDYEFIKKKTEDTFFDPSVATKELIDEVYDIVNDRSKGIRVVATAKSAVRMNVSDRLHEVKCPTLLIWGKEDRVTPSFVAEKFHELIDNTELYILDNCGHAPMMELPDQFNDLLITFLNRYNDIPANTMVAD
jgi:2-hydroxy-6-oxonona-2,4-dienedioate hydrolase